MRSSNPYFSSLTKERTREERAAGAQNQPYGGYQNNFQNPYQQYGQAQQFGSMPPQGVQPVQSERAMTVDDVITKTGITLGVIIVGAILNYALSWASPGISALLTMVGAFGGLITVFVSAFRKQFGSAGVTLTYAAFEGLFVGGLSAMFVGTTMGSSNGAAIIGQAVIGTIGVFIGMLFVYKSGTIRVTPKVNRIMLGCLMGVVVLSLGNLILFLITGMNPLTDGGPIAIIFSLVCIGLAAFSFLQDFDTADQLVRAGAPAQMAWGVALGLAVTLVWLYTEILRFLSYFRD